MLKCKRARTLNSEVFELDFCFLLHATKFPQPHQKLSMVTKVLFGLLFLFSHVHNHHHINITPLPSYIASIWHKFHRIKCRWGIYKSRGIQWWEYCWIVPKTDKMKLLLLQSYMCCSCLKRQLILETLITSANYYSKVMTENIEQPKNPEVVINSEVMSS